MLLNQARSGPELLMAHKVLKRSTMPMGNRVLRPGLFVVVALVLASSNIRASLIYTYDFPGPGPDNGLASNQTNPQPPNATMSDFTRSPGQVGTGNTGVFGSSNWSTSATLDPTTFNAFTITANPGFVLSLSQLQFDSLKNGATAPMLAEVDLFLNGSTTAYASFDWTPQNSPLTHYVFNFPTVNFSDNVTTATFQFFGWNATSSTNQILFDNVALYGGIDVPEAAGLGPAALVLLSAVSLHQFRSRRQGHPQSRGLSK
jgi:hypothetical protein